ncbi:hypothetical protein AUI06_09865 [archaeon 13_2_20CM_2_52_21]|nr:MAG: hypothetical protein AUI06_09865 [archaeon 13_2_20CM_2_52_21]
MHPESGSTPRIIASNGDPFRKRGGGHKVPRRASEKTRKLRKTPISFALTKRQGKPESSFEPFKQKGTDLVALSVPAVEIGAMKLYGKMGFEPRAQFLWKRLDS